MTDVAPKTPNKRKSFGGKQGSPKKAKLENGQTPQVASAKKQHQNKNSPKPQKNQQTPKKLVEQTPFPQKKQQTPKVINQTPNQKNLPTPKQKNTQTPQQKIQQTPTQTPKQISNNQAAPKDSLNKSHKKNKKNQSPKVAPFKGTSQIKGSLKKEKKTSQLEGSVKKEKQTLQIEGSAKKEKKTQKPDNKSTEPRVKKPRRNPFFSIKEKIHSTDDNAKTEAVSIIQGKIKAIESRGELTKTAIRKLKLLKKFQRVAQGIPAPPPATKKPNDKTVSTKRRERRNKAKVDKDGTQKSNQTKVAVVKQDKKKLVQVKAESEESDESDDDDDSDDGTGIKQEPASDSESEDETGIKQEPASDSEDGGDSGEEEESDDEEEQSDDEDESEEDSD